MSSGARDLRIGPVRLSVTTFIYGTILLQVALAIYDDDEVRPFTVGVAGEIALVIVGILAAVGLAHLLADIAQEHIARRHFPDPRTLRHLAASNAQYLYVAVLPIMILLAYIGAADDANDAIAAIEFIAIVSLFGWGALAGSRAGRWQAVAYGIAYAVLGIAIAALEVWITH